MFKHACVLFLLALMLLPSGCASRRPAEIQPLSPRELEQFFSRAQDERRFWLTKYESDQGPVFAGAHRLHTGKFAYVPFEARRQKPVPMISIRFRSPEEYMALIDASARANWIEFGLAREIGLIPIGPPSYRHFAMHADDPIPGYLSVASRVVIDQLHVETALMYVKAAHGPMKYLTRDDRDMRAPIVLGSEFIRAFHYVQIDYPNQHVLFSTTTPYRPHTDRLIASVPMRDIYGAIAVEGFIDDMPAAFLLDTIGDYAVAGTFSTAPDVRQIMIGDLVLRNTPYSDLEMLGLGMPDVPRLGRQVLSRYIVTFDGRNRQVHFERP